VAKICLCLTAKTIKRDLDILNKYRKFADLVELRVDCLDPDERLLIRSFPELAGLPVILTIRRDVDGGYFSGGEGERVKLFARGLAYANADSRFNFAYIDLEDDFDVPSLEEAAHTFGTKIIRSYHDLSGKLDDIPAKIASMLRAGDEIIKVAAAVKSTHDVLRVFEAAKNCHAQEKIFLCMGHYGLYTRILAERFGSYLTYSSALSESEIPAAPGQLDIQELAEFYRFRKITKKTKVFGIIGNPLKATISPWFYNNIFSLENADAVYVPFPVTSVPDFLKLADEMNIQGISATVPHKEAVLPALAKYSPAVRSIGACNTMYRCEEGWFGENTDHTGFSASLLNFIGKKNFKKQKITIIGAGGAARAAASEISNLGGKALVLNRTVYKAKNLASRYNFRWGGLDSQGIDLVAKYSDIIIQTTSVGMEGYDAVDPLEAYSFTGKEAVMDMIYTPPETPFLKRAAAAGCRTLNGYDMVIRQACLQYACFFKSEISQQLFARLNTTGANAWNKIRTG